MKFRVTAVVLLAGLGFAAQGAGQDSPGTPPEAPKPPDVTRDFYATLWDEKTLVAEMRANEAAIVDRKSLSGELRGGDIVYYTKPQGEQSVQKVNIKFGAGAIDGVRKTFLLRDGVDVHMEDGSRIEASTLVVDYHAQTMRSETPVRVAFPGATLMGLGLEADDTMKEMTIPREGALTVVGDPADLMRRSERPASADSNIQTRLRCAGPLSIRDLSGEVIGSRRYFRILADQKVRIEQETPGRRTQAFTDSAVIYASQLRTASEALEPVSVTLRGSIEVTDSDGLHVRAHTLDWELQEDVLRMTGLPYVEVGQGAQRVRSRYCVYDRWSGRASFTGDPSASLAAEGKGTPLHLVADQFELVMAALAGKTQPVEMRAIANVRLHGDAGQKVGRVDSGGTLFVWNVLENRGILRGEPFASIEQGETRIRSPEICFEGRTLYVLKGPKHLRFVRIEPPGAAEKAWAFAAGRPAGRRTEISATARGDVSYDGTTGRIHMSDQCRVKTDELALEADRLSLIMAADGSTVQELQGSSAVRIQRAGITLYGDRFSYFPDRQAVEIRGHPYAVASMRGIESRNEILRLDQATGRIELEGGRYGGVISLPR